MAAYLVQIKSSVPGLTLMGGYDSFIVEADSTANARSVAAARVGNDVDVYSDSDVVDVTEIAAGSDLENWTLRLRLYEPGVRQPVVDVEAVGGASDAPDDVAATAVTALNATSVIANASYDGTTNVLTVAGAGDSVGDHTLSVDWIPPWGETSYTPFVGDITDGGSEGDAVTLDMPADDDAIPNYVTALKSYR